MLLGMLYSDIVQYLLVFLDRDDILGIGQVLECKLRVKKFDGLVIRIPTDYILIYFELIYTWMSFHLF